MAVFHHALLMRINELGFAMDELRLFLDTHPDCTEALSQYNELQNRKMAAVAEYEAKYGPLTSYGNVNCDNWDWGNRPWPWQN
jgi:spore coat protein JB